MDWTQYNASDVLWLGDWGPGVIIALACLGLAILSLSAYDLRPLPAIRRRVLLGLRAAVFLLAVGVLLEPAVDLKHVTKVKNDVVVLFDVSASMSLPADGSKKRIDYARQAFEALDLPASGTDENHNYRVYSMSDVPKAIARDSVLRAEPDGLDSGLGNAISWIHDEHRRNALGGVVVISDGIDSSAVASRTQHGESLDTLSDELVKSLGAPINTIATATSETVKDLAIKRVSHDDFAFVHNKISIDVDVQVVGFDGAGITVRLERDGKLLQARELPFEKGKSNYRISFEFIPKQLGREVYRVALPVFEGEALTENNQAFFVQKVIRDKIRVLQVVGRPSWDERYLRVFLKRNPNIDLISFFILRTAENPEMAPASEMSLIPFPTDELFQKELGSFDLVVFQNFNFGPYNMRRYLPNIEKFVRDGGGFVMVGGDLSFASGGYAGTPIEGILPVKLPPAASNTLIDTSEFHPVLTEAGAHHPITQLAFDPAVNTKLWATLPPQRGSNLVLEAREGATVLATHPRLKAGGQPMPVITVTEAGKGRVMTLTTDSTWRWAFTNASQGGTSREYQMFWNSTMRWLIKDPELKLLRLELDDEEVALSSEATGTVRVSKPDYTPSPGSRGEFVVTHTPFDRIGDPTFAPEVVEQLTFKTDNAGKWPVNLTPRKTGLYRATATVETEAGKLTDTELFIATESAAEFRDIVPREDLLAALAEATQGVHTPFAETPALSLRKPTEVKINRRRVIHIWDSLPLFLMILGLLGTEWTLRRRWGRL